MKSRIFSPAFVGFALFMGMSAPGAANADPPAHDPHHDDEVFALTFLTYFQEAFPIGLLKTVSDEGAALSPQQVDLLQIAVLSMAERDNHPGILSRTAVLAALADSLVVIPESFSSAIEKRLQEQVRFWKGLLENHRDLISEARRTDPGSPRLDPAIRQLAVYHWFAAAALILKGEPFNQGPEATQILMQGGLSMRIEDFIAFPEEIRHHLLLYYFRTGLRLVEERFGKEDQPQILASIQRTLATVSDPRLSQIMEAIGGGDLSTLEKIWKRGNKTCGDAVRRPRRRGGGDGFGRHRRGRRS